MKRPLTRKQRSRLGLCLMLLLSSAIIGGGLLAAVWMDKLVPSFTNEIIRLADDDTATPLFSWNDNTNLSIYPWSQFNAAKSRPINEREMEILREGTADSYIYSILGEKQNRVDDTLLRQFVVGDEASDSERYMFLKDAVITLTDGRRYMMNSAAAESTGTVAYLHFKDIDAEPATKEEFNAAYQQVEEYLKEFYQAYILFYEHTEMNKIVPVDKEVVAFFEKMHMHMHAGASLVIYRLWHKRCCFACLRSGILDYILCNHCLVCHIKHRSKLNLDFNLSRSAYLMMVIFDSNAPVL